MPGSKRRASRPRAHPVRRTIGQLLSALSAARALHSHAAPKNAALIPVRTRAAGAGQRTGGQARRAGRHGALGGAARRDRRQGPANARRLGRSGRRQGRHHHAPHHRRRFRRSPEAGAARPRRPARAGHAPGPGQQAARAGGASRLPRRIAQCRARGPCHAAGRGLLADDEMVRSGRHGHPRCRRLQPVRRSPGPGAGRPGASSRERCWRLPFAFLVGQIALPALPGFGWFTLFVVPILVPTALAHGQSALLSAWRRPSPSISSPSSVRIRR